MLKEGSLELEKDGIRFKSMKSPCIINAAPLIGRKNSYLVYAKTECEISFIKKQLLLSVIESDNNLCVKFCSHLAFQLIEQLHDFNLLSINHMNQLFLNQFGSAKVPAEKAKNRKDVNRLRRNPVEPPLPVSGKVVLQKQKSHMVIKLTSSLSAEIRLDPKHRRDVEFRDLFQLPNDEFLLKGSPLPLPLLLLLLHSHLLPLLLLIFFSPLPSVPLFINTPLFYFSFLKTLMEGYFPVKIYTVEWSLPFRFPFIPPRLLVLLVPFILT